MNVVSNRVPMKSSTEPIAGAVELRGDTAAEERTGAFSVDGGASLLAFHADYFDRRTDDVEIADFAQSDALRRALIDAGEEPDGVRERIPNTASEANGGALGASVIGDAARGGLSWSRYETNYGIPGEATAFIDMQQDRYDAKAEIDLDGAISAVHFNGAYNDYTHTEFEAPGKPGTVFNQDAYELCFAADHELGAGWRGAVGAQYVNVDFEALGEEAFVPASQTQTTSVFAFEERHFDRWTLELGARAEQDGAKFRGFEAEVTFPLLQQGERHLALRLASDYVRGELDGGVDLPQIQPLRVGAGLHYEQDQLHLGLQAFRYSRQDKIAVNELPTDGFTLIDADASYRLPLASGGIFMFLRGANLLDEDARQHASPLKDIAPCARPIVPSRSTRGVLTPAGAVVRCELRVGRR